MLTAAVIGTGLIGASIGLATKTQGWRVVGWDPDPAALASAHEKEALDEVAESAARAADPGARCVGRPFWG